MASPSGSRTCRKLDFCVVGCVAVTRAGGRTGKGAGFADLEQGVFRELGLVDDNTPLATTVHSSASRGERTRGDGEPRIRRLHYIATETELIATGTAHPQPRGVDWAKVRPDQFADIPFLAALRERIEARQG